MKYHCGVLDEDPSESTTLKWIRQVHWTKLPPEIEHELRVWLAMPGVTITWHVHVLGVHRKQVEDNIGGYDRYRQEVGENWLSATREDCVRLSQMRPGTGHVPLISQMRAVEDLKTRSMTQVAQDYRVTTTSLRAWRTTGFRFDRELPSGFELLVA